MVNWIPGKRTKRRKIPDFLWIRIKLYLRSMSWMDPLDPSSVSFSDRSFPLFFFLYFTSSFISSSIQHYDRSWIDSRSINFNQSTMYLRIWTREVYVIYINGVEKILRENFFPNFPSDWNHSTWIYLKLVGDDMGTEW